MVVGGGFEGAEDSGFRGMVRGRWALCLEEGLGFGSCELDISKWVGPFHDLGYAWFGPGYRQCTAV